MGKNYTIKALKRIIKDLPDDMRVVIDGYEGGIGECEEIKVAEIFIGVGSPNSYSGIHEEAEKWQWQMIEYEKDEEELEKLNKIEKCLYIAR